MQQGSANYHSHTRLELLELHCHPPANLCLLQAHPTPSPPSLHTSSRHPYLCCTRAEQDTGRQKRFHGAAELPVSQGQGHRDCLWGQAGLAVGRRGLGSHGQAVIVTLATDPAGGAGGVGDGQASAYQGVPAGSLCCTSQEPSSGDKF